MVVVAICVPVQEQELELVKELEGAWLSVWVGLALLSFLVPMAERVLVDFRQQ